MAPRCSNRQVLAQRHKAGRSTAGPPAAPSLAPVLLPGRALAVPNAGLGYGQVLPQAGARTLPAGIGSCPLDSATTAPGKRPGVVPASPSPGLAVPTKELPEQSAPVQPNCHRQLAVPKMGFPERSALVLARCPLRPAGSRIALLVTRFPVPPTLLAAPAAPMIHSQAYPTAVRPGSVPTRPQARMPGVPPSPLAAMAVRSCSSPADSQLGFRSPPGQ